tara:strand:- start:96 stop:251 length:156 start_codon:yes stop_codon:yes gene_type:complete
VIEFKHHLYCFLNDKGAVFLNRWDEVIMNFKSYKEAIDYASNNFNLINIKK